MSDDEEIDFSKKKVRATPAGMPLRGAPRCSARDFYPFFRRLPRALTHCPRGAIPSQKKKPKAVDDEPATGAADDDEEIDFSSKKVRSARTRQ